jgi:hypothetical protein
MQHYRKLTYVILFICIISLVGAAQTSLGTFEQGECFELIQTCDTCTYNNISNVMSPNSTNYLNNVAMERSDTYYNHSFCDTFESGGYVVNGYGDLDGVKTIWQYDFEITPSGASGDNLGFYIVIIALVYGIALIGFFGRNEIIALIGSLSMLGLAIYLINEGLIIYRDWFTNSLAYFSIALGVYISFMASYSLYRNL